MLEWVIAASLTISAAALVIIVSHLYYSALLSLAAPTCIVSRGHVDTAVDTPAPVPGGPTSTTVPPQRCEPTSVPAPAQTGGQACAHTCARPTDTGASSAAAGAGTGLFASVLSSVAATVSADSSTAETVVTITDDPYFASFVRGVKHHLLVASRYRCLALESLVGQRITVSNVTSYGTHVVVRGVTLREVIHVDMVTELIGDMSQRCIRCDHVEAREASAPCTPHTPSSYGRWPSKELYTWYCSFSPQSRVYSMLDPSADAQGLLRWLTREVRVSTTGAVIDKCNGGSVKNEAFDYMVKLHVHTLGSIVGVRAIQSDSAALDACGPQCGWSFSSRDILRHIYAGACFLHIGR